MVTFLRFFLGLTVGVHGVDVAVDHSVARLELRLDGATVAVVEEAPWSARVDFGTALLPHKLEAVAFDGDGRESGRAEQFVNLPRPDAEASIALLDHRDGRYRRAEIAWATVDETPPVEILVQFDGEPVEPIVGETFALPPHDAGQFHVLSAELRFDNDMLARAELAFGGLYGEAVSAELTAVVIELGGGRLPAAGDLQGQVLVDGRAPRVVAVEKGRAGVMVVRDRSSRKMLDAFRIEAWRRVGARSRSSTASQYLERGLRRRDTLHYVLPTPRTVANDRGSVTAVFPVYGDLNRIERGGGMGYALTHAHPDLGSEEQYLASAVGIAGIRAAGGNQARAVVLVLGEDAHDSSDLTPTGVATFLESLQVPLFVWRLADGDSGDPAPSAWSSAVTIRTFNELNRAIDDVGEALSRQAVVWLEGTYLPQDVSLSPPLRQRLDLAGSRR